MPTMMEDRFNSPETKWVEVEAMGHRLRIAQDPNSQHVGTTVWDSSIVALKYMERHSSGTGAFSRAKLKGKRGIELGAGCGLAGIGLALLGCNVVLTDEATVLPMLARNVERNCSTIAMATSPSLPSAAPPFATAAAPAPVCFDGKAGDDGSPSATTAAAAAVPLASPEPVRERVAAPRGRTWEGGLLGRTEVAELFWGNDSHIAALHPPFDVIVGTDVVYVEEAVEALVQTMVKLCHKRTSVLLGYEFRSPSVHERLHGLLSPLFSVKKVPRNKLHPTFQHPSIDLFVLKPRPHLFAANRANASTDDARQPTAPEEDGNADHDEEDGEEADKASPKGESEPPSGAARGAAAAAAAAEAGIAVAAAAAAIGGDSSASNDSARAYRGAASANVPFSIDTFLCSPKGQDDQLLLTQLACGRDEMGASAMRSAAEETANAVDAAAASSSQDALPPRSSTQDSLAVQSARREEAGPARAAEASARTAVEERREEERRCKEQSLDDEADSVVMDGEPPGAFGAVTTSREDKAWESRRLGAMAARMLANVQIPTPLRK